MSNFTYAFVFIIVMNTLLALSQFAMDDLGAGSKIYNCTNGVLDVVSGSQCQAQQPDLNPGTIAGQLPSVETTPSTGGTNIFTDIFTSIVKWAGSVPGVNYVTSFVSSPSRILKSAGLPEAFTYLVGGMWWVISIMVFAGYMWWRD